LNNLPSDVEISKPIHAVSEIQKWEGKEEKRDGNKSTAINNERQEETSKQNNHQSS